jgi:hypothetical protein
MPIESPFVDASALLAPNPPELSYGCLMADLDRDGLPELLVVNVGAPNRLYKWRNDRLTDVASPIVGDANASGIGVACGDINGDGLLDIYILNTSVFMGPYSDPDRLLLNRGDLKFIDLFDGNPHRNTAAGRSVVFFDPEGNERHAAYVCNYAVPCRLYVQTDDGDVVDIAARLNLNQLTGGRSAIAADLSGSGRIDLFTANENDRNRLFRNKGSLRFEEIARELGLDDPAQHARGLAVCDFDRDGRLDLVWGNWEGPHRIMRQTPEGRFVNVADRAFSRPSRVRTVIVFDFDNDGWEDIFLNNLGEPNRLFHNNGDGTFSEIDPGPLALEDGLGTGATCGDLNGDGFLDLFISHGESARQPNALFLNSPNGNGWIRIHAQTTAGAPALGATVVVHAEGDERPMTRVIDGGSGYLCQLEPVAHFGLGRAERASRARVRFTNGRVWEGRDIPGGTNLTVRPLPEGAWHVEAEEP